MTAGMTDVSPSEYSETPIATSPRPPVSVVVAVTVVHGVDPAATIAAVARQDRTAASVSVIGADPETAPDLQHSPDLETLVAALGNDVEYVWILHGDAEPRPDALRFLVEEAERHDAALVGSKLLIAGTKDTLESVGSATDVFGEPYSGLDEGEVDLEQYDVVRDVAFVASISMLVRRDVLRGLRGLDPAVPPIAAGLDLSQRVRIAGGRVMVTPSSEVFHHGRCEKDDGGWHEQAGRLRAMMKAYRPVTLLWMVPFAFVTGLLDALGNLFLGRWRPTPRLALTWAWNLWRLPSTLGARRNIARVRQVGDEELFRYQVRGSVRLRIVGSELSNRLLGMFDEDRVLTRRAFELWSSSTTWAAFAAVVAVVVGVRAVFLGGLPVVGHSLPFVADAGAALGRYFGGWNAAGLGSDTAVHPAAGLGGVVQTLLFGDPDTARAVVTIGAMVLGVFGMSRLATRLRVGGIGGYAGAVVALFGPVAAVLAGGGRWAGLMGAALLPWALSSVIGRPAESRRRRIGDVGRAALWTGLVASFVPLLAVVPLLFAVALKAVGRFPSRPTVALAALSAGLVGLPYLLDHPERILDERAFDAGIGLVGLAALAVAAVTAMVAGAWRVGALGGTLTFGGLVVARSVGSEAQVAVLALAAVGSGLVVAAALRHRERRKVLGWVAAIAGVVAVGASLPGLGGGRAGMPPDMWGEELEFIALAPNGVERALLVAPSAADLPGDSRSGPGFWYRVVDSEGPTLDAAVLARPGPGDDALRATLEELMAGATLRPGAALSEFGIRWLVAVGESSAVLAPLLDAQVDLAPLPLSETTIVYENDVPASVASGGGVSWSREGSGYAGPAVDASVRLAIQGDDRWAPGWQPADWAGTVSGRSGEAWFEGVTTTRVVTIAGSVFVLIGIGAWLWGRRESV